MGIKSCWIEILTLYQKTGGILMAKNYSNTNNSNKNTNSKNSSYSSYADTQNKNKNANKNSSNATNSKNCGRTHDAFDESDRY